MTSNFLQVGRTIKCEHCDINFEVSQISCECICHGYGIGGFDLQFCSHCVQETNHLVGVCQKCLERPKKTCLHLHLEDIQAFIPYFMADNRLKIKTMKDRGSAKLHVTLFLDWMKHHITTK